MKEIINRVKRIFYRNDIINPIIKGSCTLRNYMAEKHYLKRSPNLDRQVSFLKLLLSHRSENSILDNPGNLIPYEVGDRRRYATCSGISWFEKEHLAVVNLYGQHARIYKIISNKTAYFEPFQLKLVYEFKEDINFPEDLSIAKNRKYVAITNTLSDKKGVSVFEMDPVSFHFKKLINRVCLEHTCHGIQFSPDSKYLTFTIISPPGSVEVYSVSDFSIIPVFTLENPDALQRPKAVCFTEDSKFIAVLYSYAAGPSSNKRNNKSRICIHRYFQKTGKIDNQFLAQYIYESDSNSAFEIGTFRSASNGNQHSLYVTDQEDKVFEFVFDSQILGIELKAFYGKDIPFPHGIDISPDGNYLAVTTLGDDSIKIFNLIDRDSIR